jgi:hypothetical protein
VPVSNATPAYQQPIILPRILWSNGVLVKTSKMVKIPFYSPSPCPLPSREREISAIPDR